MPDFHLLIAVWYRQNKRDLPWRTTKNPYFVWLSEIILQQTRVNQGMNYYLKFVNNYPTVNDLAHAEEGRILNDWQGLGYYSRARNLHAAAKQIVTTFEGEFPSSFQTIKTLKGVGDYTAAAIASFSFDEAVAVVDGNVYRVLARVFDIEIPIDSTEGKKVFQELANQLLNIENPAEHNQAIMEFGALQCVPVNPSCETCPLNTQCLSFANNTIRQRPVKKGKTKVSQRYFHYLVFKKNHQILLEKRETQDIWKHLYQFPLIETLEPKELDTEFFTSIGIEPHLVSSEVTHILSHQKIHARFYHFADFPAEIPANSFAVKVEAIQDYALPRLIDRYLEKQEL